MVSALLNNRYRPLQILGQGGCGRTYLAEDTHMPSKRRCVIKQLKPATNDPRTYQIIKERFEREAAILEVLGRLSDQIPTLYAYFTEDQEFYLVQDWIEGKSLAQTVKEKGLFSEGRVRNLLIDILPVLDYIHSQGIIHRDIKPDNIMLREQDGKPILIDFGAVKQVVATPLDSDGTVQSSIVMGSPGFMPLEQAAGKPVFSSDLYSLGLTAIYLLTGKSPLDLIDVSTGRLAWRGHAGNVSPALASVLDKTTNPFPHERYSTAREMLQAIWTTDTISDVTVPAAQVSYNPAPRQPNIPVPPANILGPGQQQAQTGQVDSSKLFVYGLVLLLAFLVSGAALALFFTRRFTAPGTESGISSQGRSSLGPNQERTPTNPTVPQMANFVVTQTQDAFTSVRLAPTTKSPEMGRLYPGTRISCQSIVKGERLWEIDDWRYCPSVGGYIHSRLLTPVY